MFYFVNEIMEFRSFVSRIKSKIRHLFVKQNKSFGTLYSEYGKKIDRPLLEKFWVEKNSHYNSDICRYCKNIARIANAVQCHS